MAWFAVRTFFRIRPVGRPRRRDAAYRGGVATLEDRLVLVRAKDGAAALRRGEAEARQYAKGVRSRNAYGQRVIAEPLGYMEAYELFDPPGDGVEIFSSMEVISAREACSTILARKVGEPTGPSTARLFIDGGLARELDAIGATWGAKTPANSPLQRTGAGKQGNGRARR